MMGAPPGGNFLGGALAWVSAHPGLILLLLIVLVIIILWLVLSGPIQGLLGGEKK